MHIENLDSQQTVSAAEEKSLLQRIDFLLDCFWRTPFYLVDPQTMDKLYPPEKRRLLDEECVERVLAQERESAGQNEHRDPLEEAERLLGRITECRREISGRMIAVGLFLNGQELHDLKAKTNWDVPSVGSIFVCPERVEEWAKVVGKTFPKTQLPQLLFEAIAIHELAHAFMDGPGKKGRRTEAARVIEESLANAIAFGHFTANEKPSVSRCFAEQPMEYRAYPFWTLRGDRTLREAAMNWRLKGNALWPFAWWGDGYCWDDRREFFWMIHRASTDPKFEARLAVDLLGSVVLRRQP